jgi:hypothetical protein
MLLGRDWLPPVRMDRQPHLVAKLTMMPAERNQSCGNTMEKEPVLESRKFHEVWIEQCEAAKEIRLRYGLRAAFDYLVAEKLLNFADAATTHPEFARELPRFVAGVRALFTVEEMRAHLKRMQREHEAYINAHDRFDEQDEQLDEDAPSLESTTVAAERNRQFGVISELLTVAELGTS